MAHSSSKCCNANAETLASALNNFQTAFFGTVTKTCVNGKVVWTLPCDLDAGIDGYPRLAGEGVACYLLRIFQTINVNMSTGYMATTLSATDVELSQSTDVKYQEFNGTLTADVDINVDSVGAVAGNGFQLYWKNIDLGAFTLRLLSEGTVVKTWTGPGTLSGFTEFIWSGSQWEPTKNSTDIV